MSNKQTALLLTALKGDFTVGTADIPKPGPGEILAEVQATALNPADWKVKAFGIIYSKFPAIIGSDGASVVKEVGEGVTNVSVGDKILHQGAFDNRRAINQQYTIAHADLVAKIPPHLSFEQAASLPVAVSTAAMGLYNHNGLALTPPWEAGGKGKYFGNAFFVIGGSAAVGQTAIQFAKLSGFSPIIVTASKKHEAFLKSLGATHVVDRQTPLSELPKTVQQITSAPIKYAYDAVGEADTQTAAYEVLADEGNLVSVQNPAVDKAKLTPSKKIVQANCYVHGPTQRELSVKLYQHLSALLEAGDIKPNNIEIVPNGLAGISEGLEKLKSGKVSATKLVARIADTPAQA